MRILISVLLLALVFSGLPALPGHAQNLLNQPESVVYDAPRDRYLVSNYGDGSIVAIDAAHQQSYFNTSLTKIAGLHILNGILYVASSGEPDIALIGFDLETGERIASIWITDPGMLNGITSDDSGNLYVTDFYNSKIYKIRPDHSWSVFVDADLNMPNGIIFDAPNDRLLTVMQNEAGYPMKAIDIADSSVSVVMNTQIPSVDGITVDSGGSFYISSWYYSAVLRYDPALSGPPETFSTGHDGPADIYYDAVHDLIAVPNFYTNSVDFLPVDLTSVEGAVTPGTEIVFETGSNPFKNKAHFSYELKDAADVHIDIYNIAGRKRATLVDGVRAAGSHHASWNAELEPSGLYFYRLQVGERSRMGKLLLLR
ncbi:MAG: SMP-30/gluconolactonase/LRE family protein [Candidatus Eisenbacteria bacterium]|uniref:SMP-30/gluconolactonase/LRE family protein n=1 Tax=Eiseniibacteriota bacterium TaxID=2212470 RepID=A0A948W7H1_UNCEI|nr:SMP-30/gluconolactonase/LRE family protein [Candidatus Eisenbacteria bacterium]MBU1948337.1 SMP-30/gluconolactonase/LRE family protein [Candidatus Eisenbacteria bacterium]MBU2692230.1 SMP-30/gluconolactonase/LRE family protein [Candidatus Eisenbacteria bacterium]